jgi:erythromycin esterase
MLRMLPFAFLAWLVCSATISARADDLDAARKVVEAQYARLDAAMARKDPSPLEGLVAPEFRQLDPSGDESDLGQATRLWQQTWAKADVEALTVRSEVQSVALDADGVRSVVRVVLAATLRQKGGPAVKLRTEDIVHDAWVKIGLEWRLRRTATMHSKAWINDDLMVDLPATRRLAPARRDAIVGELRARAIPVKTVMAGAGFDDLAALDQLIGDARIVALGDASHGTAETVRVAHRLLEYLVERKGFTVLAIEGWSWPDVEIVDRYVKTGEGIAMGFATNVEAGALATEEVRDLIEWMRAYNSVPGRAKLLSFTGFDISRPGAAVKCVIDAFNRLDASRAKTIERYYDGAEGMYRRMHPLFPANEVMPDAEKAKLRGNVAEALKLVESHRDALLRILTPVEYARVLQCATVVVQASLPGANKRYEGLNARDEAMVRNVKWLAEEAFAGEKIVLWAHNAHVAGVSFVPGVTPMGQHLRLTFGNQMRVLGYAFDRGHVRAFRTKQGKSVAGGRITMEVPTAKSGSMEEVLRATGIPRFVLDLRGVPPTSELGTWMNEPQRLRLITATYDPDDAAIMILPKAFDALIYIEQTTATTPLR